MGDTFEIVSLYGKAFCRKYAYADWNSAKARIMESLDVDRLLVFRGQACSLWGLSTSIERMVKPSVDSSRIEELMRLEFHRGVGAFIQTEPRTSFEHLEMMQHYGAPTRLLDCTKSPYIAAYFAFEHPPDERAQYATVWMIDAGWLTSHNIRIYKGEKDILKRFASHLWHLADYQDADNLFKDNAVGILPLFPSKMDARMLAQQSIFLVPTNIEIPLVQSMEPYYDDLNERFPPPVTRIDISNAARRSAIRDLDRMNINAQTMYPGLEGFIKSFRWKYELRGWG